MTDARHGLVQSTSIRGKRGSQRLGRARDALAWNKSSSHWMRSHFEHEIKATGDSNFLAKQSSDFLIYKECLKHRLHTWYTIGHPSTLCSSTAENGTVLRRERCAPRYGFWGKVGTQHNRQRPRAASLSRICLPPCSRRWFVPQRSSCGLERTVRQRRLTELKRTAMLERTIMRRSRIVLGKNPTLKRTVRQVKGVWLRCRGGWQPEWRQTMRHPSVCQRS